MITLAAMLFTVPLGTGVVNGVAQPYPHCNGITVLDDEAPLEELQGIVRRTEMARPCIGQEPYLVLRVDTGGKTVAVYLGPTTYLSEHGLQFAPGDSFRASVAHGGRFLTALSVEQNGRLVALRDGQGHPYWDVGRAAH